MYKYCFIILVILFCLFNTCNEGYTNFHVDEFDHIDGSEQDDGFFHVDTIKENPKKGHPSLLNVYGEPLQPCRSKDSSDRNGSWNSDGYCDETGGGVHQICLEVNKTPDFSLKTGQGPWSEGRKGKNHCMCLGAWALYKAKQEKGLIPTTDNELKCESIMDDALHERYVGKWNTWNGNELNNQIIHGVNELMDQCYEKGNSTQKQNIKELYKKLTHPRTEFHRTETHQKHT